MDPVLLGVVTGIVANALTPLVLRAGRKSIDFATQKTQLFDFVTNISTADSVLSRSFREAVWRLTKQDLYLGAPYRSKINSFLKTPEAEEIARQICSFSLVKSFDADNPSEPALSQIRDAFLVAFSRHVEKTQGEVKDVATEVFNIVMAAFDTALSMAIERGCLAAHEAKSVARHRLVLDELRSVRKALDSLSRPSKPDVRAFLQFEKRYRDQVRLRHQSITPPQFDAARKVKIVKIYVPTNFTRKHKINQGSDEPLSPNDFLSISYRSVVLGNPGAGKSTFAQKLCYDLASKYSSRILLRRLATPILVVLRDYGAAKKASNLSIVQFIEQTANAKYQLPPPDGAFEYLLSSGRAMVIFDGLDELLETQYRQEISGDVEAFCNLYSTVPVIVTSRAVGYEQAPLDEELFEIFGLSPFDDEQVGEYVNKWFALDTDSTPEEVRATAKAFLEESKVVSDLRSNPLMLSLMCNIYRGENYIPRNRPDVYEKCAVMLFERWDRKRNIAVTIPLESLFDRILKHLARWIYSDDRLQAGVSEEQLVAKTADYLHPRRFDDPDDAKKAAENFVAFCRNRAWVFTDTGTTRKGERLYQFTHRTFLEYFTAADLVRNHPTPELLGEILLPKIIRREWDVVAQLAIQLQNKGIEDAGDKLLITILNAHDTAAAQERGNLLSFAARCLEFLVPSPAVTKRICDRCVTYCFDWGLKRMSEGFEQVDDQHSSQESGTEMPGDILGALVNCAEENKDVVKRSITDLVVDAIRKKPDKENVFLFEIVFNLPIGVHRFLMGRRPIMRIHAFAEEICTAIQDSFDDNELDDLSLRYPEVGLDFWWRKRMSLRGLVTQHGIGMLFKHKRFILFPYVYGVSPMESLVRLFVEGRRKGSREFDRKTISESLALAGELLSEATRPWVYIEGTDASEGYLYHVAARLDDYQTRWLKAVENPYIGFALWAAFAVSFETCQKLGIRSPQETALEACTQLAEKTRGRLMAALFSSIVKRFGGETRNIELEMVDKELKQHHFSPTLRSLVLEWANGGVDLVVTD